MSPVDLKELEIRRVTDLSRSFGYAVVGTEFQDKKAIIRLEKTFEVGTVDMLRSDGERFANVLKQFQWSVLTSSVSERKVMVTFEIQVAGEI